MSYSYSTDGERFNGEFATIEEALKEVKEIYGDGQEVSIGENGVFHPFVGGEDVMERLQDQAYEEMGEAAEIYLEGISNENVKELSEILTKTFNEWAVKHGYEPRCYPVDNIKKYTVGGETK